MDSQPITVDSLRDRRVLVVDDNPTTQHILKRYVEGASGVVTLAGSGEAGLAMLEKQPGTLPLTWCCWTGSYPG